VDFLGVIKNILESILPDKVFNISFDNRKVEFNADSIVFGDQTITDPQTVADIFDKVFEKVEEYKGKESLPCQLIHKDLSGDYTDYEKLSIHHKESIVKLNSVLPLEDVECILAARRIKAAYDRADMDSARKHQEKLDRDYPRKGSRIYNLVGAGYFDELLVPFIDIFREKYGVKYIEEYQKFYYDTLRFFPIAVFVGNSKDEEKIESELIERLNRKGIPFVRLHAIGTNNIRKIDNVIEKLKIREDYPVDVTSFTTPGGLRAVIYEVTVTLNEGESDDVSGSKK